MSKFLEVEQLDGVEILRYTLLFCYNWSQEDFIEAFGLSGLGWQYFWQKHQTNLDATNNGTEAIVLTISNLDNKHQQLLFDYIFKSKYNQQISKAREWQKLINETNNK